MVSDTSRWRRLFSAHSPSPPEIPAEPDYDGDFDYEDQASERELLMDDLADDNDDFARSEEDGWYYSDEN
jgi:hypothetical protein